MSICLQNNVRHKFLVKVRSFSATKVSCMIDHVRPIILDNKPDHVILHTGTNDLRSEKTVSQIVRSITAMFLNDKACSVIVSDIVLRHDSPNNEVIEFQVFFFQNLGSWMYVS